MRQRAPKRLYALILSFGVYLFPLIGPHSIFPLGGVLWREITQAEREPLWVATDIGLALLLQAAAFAALSWLLKKPAVTRGLAVILAIPFTAVAVEYAYLVYIPSLFLIEDDTASEIGDWPEECSAPDVSLIEVGHPARAMVWPELPAQASDGSYRVLQIPGCRLIPLAVPQSKLQPGGRVDFTAGLHYFVPGRGAIFSRQETASGVFTWNHLFEGRITTMQGLHAAAVPILSLDGQWTAWMEKGSVAIERIDGNDAPLQVTLPMQDLHRYELKTVDTDRREIDLVGSDTRMVVDFDGTLKTSEALRLAWDKYRDSGPYRVSWNIEGKSGTHNVLEGRLINSAAMTPSGDLVALSVGTALNIGDIQDSIYVLRTSDGSEVYRRYLPRYSRTSVYFPTDDLMAHTAAGRVLVHRISRR